jgi:hypothetical protein
MIQPTGFESLLEMSVVFLGPSGQVPVPPSHSSYNSYTVSAWTTASQHRPNGATAVH